MESVKAGGFSLTYELNNGEITITGIEGSDSTLTIPGVVTVEGLDYPVGYIGKKAIMGVNGLRHIAVPGDVKEIGDWAFAHCIHLVSLTIEGTGVVFGRGMLEGCNRLKNVSIGYTGNDDLSYLVATTVNKFPAIYLLTSDELGSENWYRNYDSSLLQYLKESDYAGSDESALCGEEDISYDEIRSVDGELLGADASYILGVRKNKNYLCLLRLMFSQHIDAEAKTYMTEYVKSHTIGNSNNEAWLSIRDDLYDDDKFLDLFLEITKPEATDIELMLADLGNNHPEMKAMLLKYGGKSNRVDSFFDDLLL